MLRAQAPLSTQGPDTTATQERRLHELTVTSHRSEQRLQEVQIGAEAVNIRELTSIPQLFGERDVIRSLQWLPGVKAESDASSSFQVRGGTSTQNLVQLDEAPVYNLGHLAGLFSAINDEALGSATLYKGLIPAQFGGASAAVLNITGRAARQDAWHGMASVGLLAAKAAVEGPVSQKLSLLLTARRSYMDAFLKLVPDYQNNILYFYDINARLHYAPDSRNAFDLSLFMGRDHTELEDMLDMGWRNRTASLFWTHQLRDSASSKTTLLYSAYDSDNAMDLLDLKASFGGYIHQGGMRQQFQWRLSRSQFNAGFHSLLMSVQSAEWKNVASHEREVRHAWDNALWFHVIQPIGERLTVAAGLRLSAFAAMGGSLYYDINERGTIIRLYNRPRWEAVKTHWTLEPRLSLNYSLSPTLNLKAGYSRTSQNLHALRGQTLSTPFDRYIPSSNLLRPQLSDQVSLGLFGMMPRHQLDFSIEGYYRHTRNLLDYRDGSGFTSEIELERLVLAGKGQGYGVELCLRRPVGRLTGWAAYTLSWSRAKIPGINQGRWYDANNDRRHDVNLMASYRLTDHWNISAAWVYNSGQAFTAPSGKYAIEDNYIYYYAERNGYRAPDYHRLDVSATWTRPMRRATSELTFSIYNLYNHYNPFLINFEDSENGARTLAVQYSLFGILPSVAWTIRF